MLSGSLYLLPSFSWHLFPWPYLPDHLAYFVPHRAFQWGCDVNCEYQEGVSYAVSLPDASVMGRSLTQATSIVTFTGQVQPQPGALGVPRPDVHTAYLKTALFLGQSWGLSLPLPPSLLYDTTIRMMMCRVGPRHSGRCSTSVVSSNVHFLSSPGVYTGVEPGI